MVDDESPGVSNRRRRQNTEVIEEFIVECSFLEVQGDEIRYQHIDRDEVHLRTSPRQLLARENEATPPVRAGIAFLIVSGMMAMVDLGVLLHRVTP